MRVFHTAAAFALCLFAGCSIARTIPAQGVSLRWDFCGSALPSDVYVFSRHAPCPDLADVQKWIAAIEDRYRVKLGGSRLYVTSSDIDCGGTIAWGCSAMVGGVAMMTVKSGPLMGGIVRHEASHAAAFKLGDDLEHFYIDHPEERSGLRRHTE